MVPLKINKVTIIEFCTLTSIDSHRPLIYLADAFIYLHLFIYLADAFIKNNLQLRNITYNKFHLLSE